MSSKTFIQLNYFFYYHSCYKEYHSNDPNQRLYLTFPSTCDFQGLNFSSVSSTRAGFLHKNGLDTLHRSTPRCFNANHSPTSTTIIAPTCCSTLVETICCISWNPQGRPKVTFSSVAFFFPPCSSVNSSGSTCHLPCHAAARLICSFSRSHFFLPFPPSLSLSSSLLLTLAPFSLCLSPSLSNL